MGKPWRALVAVAVVAGLATPAQAQDLTAAVSVVGLFQAVTCSGSANCWAVGYLTNNLGGPTSGLTEHWDGSAWQVVPSPNPPGSSSSPLEGVACAQPANCWAVGYYENVKAATLRPYAEHWNGQAWSELAMPYQAHQTLKVNAISGVSCPGAKLCFADGYWERQSGSYQEAVGLIERWNGRSWRIVPSPVLPHSTITDLSGMSCASTRDCWGTGDWLLDTRPGVGPTRGGALGYHWNGRQWTATAISNAVYRKAAGSNIVSCPTVQMCMATGVKTDPRSADLQLPIAWRWNGVSWVTAPIGTRTSTNLIVNGVSCATPEMCMAVGVMIDTTPSITLAERWNGSSWAAIPSANPSGNLGSELYGVFCAQVTNCWAVGDWINNPEPSAPKHVLIEHWNGTAWSVVVS